MARPSQYILALLKFLINFAAKLVKMKQTIIDWIKDFYFHNINGVEIFDQTAYNDQKLYWALGMFGVLIAVTGLMWMLSRTLMVQVLHLIADRSKVTWDDHLVNNRVFASLAQIVPLSFMEYFLSIVLFEYPSAREVFYKIIDVLIIFSIIISINRILNSLRDIIRDFDKYKDKPIQSYIQVLKIITIGIMLILAMSILTEKSPLFFLTSLGAMTAILLLIFKDTILGFVGSIQLAANDIIRIGDWVTMEKFGADGDVEEISLSTVKVRNFDRTITTIPTYSFISDAFKNWRGMEESDGRRIKRAIRLEVDSVDFASPELMERLKKINLLKGFLEERQVEIEKYNNENGFVGESAINARRQTNLGLFRRYVEYYLKNNPGINQKMTLMVRQLEANEYGIPLEIYCFSKTKIWDEYEMLMADIFDHLFSIVKSFELSIYERPSGKDFRKA